MSAPAGGARHAARSRPERGRLVLALLAVWILWGSSYLAIRVVVEVAPPFLMAGARFLVAGAALLAIARVRGEGAPRRGHLGPAALAGGLLMASNGLVSWAETRVESAVAGVVIACVPLWMLLLDWARPRGVRPPAAALAGVALGIGGVAWLAAPDPRHPLDPAGLAALLAATIAWSIGSLYARGARLPESKLASAGLQMACGGALQVLAATALGEDARLDLTRLGPQHVGAWLWLVVTGSILAFTAYQWLLAHTTPAVATSYAFVNPLVALALGATLGGEVLGPRTLAASAVIVGAVALVVLPPRRARPPGPSP